jgi:hypothetical protein
MRTFTLLCAVVLASALAFGQSVVRGYPGYCAYGCGPYVPLITTPSLSFQTVSPNPVGATNATGGLLAGARNSTLSMTTGNTDAVYTVPVWYSGGGTPLVSPAVNAPVHPFRMGRMEHMEAMHMQAMHMQAMRHEHEAMREPWIYFAAPEETASAGEAAAGAKGMKRAARTYTNADVERQNEATGTVKYDSKTQKIQ